MTKGPAATVCRQMGLASNGLETWRQLVIRFSIPVGTRSIRYLTKLLKPSFDESKFEEAFATWEFETNRYERDNSAILPDNIKIAVLLKETRGALQQHLQLTASHATDYQRIRTIIIQYYRECNNSMDNSPRTTKVQHQWSSEQHGKEKAKEKERRAITKEKESQHTKERGTTTPTTTTTKEKEMVPSVKEIHSKAHQKATPAKASHHLPKERERTTPQHATNAANKVTLPGTEEFPSTTTTWENKATCQIQHTVGTTTHSSMTHPGTIRIWRHSKANTSQQQGYANTSQLALSPPPQASSGSAQAINFVEGVLIAGIEGHQGDASSRTSSFEEIMIDSGAAAHVCPPWFGTSFPLHHLEESSKPQLRTVTDNNIYVHGYCWIHFCESTWSTHRHSILCLWCQASHPLSDKTHPSGIWDQLEGQQYNDSSEVISEPHHTTRWFALYSISISSKHQCHQDTSSASTRRQQDKSPWSHQQQWQAVDHNLWEEATQIFGCSTMKDTSSEFTNDSDEQCSHHTAPIAPSTQINLRTTGRPSSNNQVNQQQKSSTASETQPRRTTDSSMDQHGSEKHGSNPSRVHQQSSRPNQQQQRWTKQNMHLQHQTNMISEHHPHHKQPWRRTSIHKHHSWEQQASNQQDTGTSQGERASDYWIRSGRLWQRAHIIPRNTLYRPETTDGGPSPDDLTSTRVTFIKPTNGNRPWWWMDNRTATSTINILDRINKLRGEGNIQGASWVRRWRQSASYQSKSNSSTKAANTTRSSGAQPDSHALLQFVSHPCSRQGQKYITSTTNKSKAHYSGRLRLPQKIWRSTGSGHPDSHRHRDRTLYGNYVTRQATTVWQCIKLHSKIHLRDWQTKQHPTIRQWAISQSITPISSQQDW